MTDLVSQAIQEVRSLPEWPLERWDLLIRQARVADLLPRLAALIEEAGVTGAVSARPRAHLQAATVLATAISADARREIEHIRKALEEVGLVPIFLKGAAYLLAELPAGKGRVFSDIDILVPKRTLPKAESALMLNGWATTHLDPYDQRYYRHWMHELPPLEHMQRQTTLDVHHAILPETARLHPDSEKLIEAAIPAKTDGRVRVLGNIDMVLHSMTHLFHNEELSHGLRDLSDIDLLLRHFGRSNEFWTRLVERATALDLTRPLYYGLRYAARIFSTPIPREVLDKTEVWAPKRPLQILMDMLWMRALRPPHPSAADKFTSLALFLLYVRAHWLRMPPLLLIYHLTVKALRREPTADGE